MTVNLLGNLSLATDRSFVISAIGPRRAANGPNPIVAEPTVAAQCFIQNNALESAHINEVRSKRKPRRVWGAF